MSKQPPPAPAASSVGPCPTVIPIIERPDTESLPSTIAPPDHPQKFRSFLFCSFPVNGVTLFFEIRHIEILNILSQMGRSFLFHSVSSSWGRYLQQNSTHSNLGYLVSDGQSFYFLFISCSWGHSLQSIWSVYGQMRTAWLDLILNMLSQKKGSFLF